jgi:3-hydroxy-9,10-secoandrosta-1,3,5(10)-triene-9,17-dione monooxygenase reductase component
MDPAEFRRVLGHWATGVAVVTSRRPDGQPCGLTVNSFASVSLEPLLVLVCIEREATSCACIEERGAFAVNVLGAERERLARRFAAWDQPDKFDGVAFREETTGSPVLEDALAWVDCRVWRTYDGGDHAIFVGEVVAGDAAAAAGAPLLYYRGGYGRFVP